MKKYFGVGTYTEPILFGTGEVFQGKGKGLYICSFEDGDLELVSVLPLRNPSFFCFDSSKRKIYTVNEAKEYNGHFGGGITEVSVAKDFTMKAEASFCTGGTDPCHIALSPNGRFVAVANFASGSMSAFRLSESGSLIPCLLLSQHEGSSVHPVRQKGPHAHSVIFDNSNRFFVPDLGIDKLVSYKYSDSVEPANGFSIELEADKDVLSKAVSVKAVSVKAGSGPRYGEFSSDYKHFYLINEIASSVTHFTYEKGFFTEIQEVSTLPEDFNGDNICSDLHLSADGSSLYASNRGHDSLAVFSIDKKDGSLKRIGIVPCGGKTPRNFCIEPSGKFILVGNQDSDNITVFKVNAEGLPEKYKTFDFPSPVCIRFL